MSVALPVLRLAEEQWATAVQRSLLFFSRMSREALPHLKKSAAPGASSIFSPGLAYVDYEELDMAKKFKLGDHVSWNSEAGRVSGTIVAVHTRDFDYKGHTHHASSDDPQYEIKSDTTDHIAAHKGGALEHVR